MPDYIGKRTGIQLWKLTKLLKEGINFSYTIAGEGMTRSRSIFAAYQLGLNDKYTFVEKAIMLICLINVKTIAGIHYSIQEGFCTGLGSVAGCRMLHKVMLKDSVKMFMMKAQMGSP